MRIKTLSPGIDYEYARPCPGAVETRRLMARHCVWVPQVAAHLKFTSRAFHRLILGLDRFEDEGVWCYVQSVVVWLHKRRCEACGHKPRWDLKLGRTVCPGCEDKRPEALEGVL
jgi:hypothetical protein